MGVITEIEFQSTLDKLKTDESNR